MHYKYVYRDKCSGYTYVHTSISLYLYRHDGLLPMIIRRWFTHVTRIHLIEHSSSCTSRRQSTSEREREMLILFNRVRWDRLQVQSRFLLSSSHNNGNRRTFMWQGTRSVYASSINLINHFRLLFFLSVRRALSLSLSVSIWFALCVYVCVTVTESRHTPALTVVNLFCNRRRKNI